MGAYLRGVNRCKQVRCSGLFQVPANSLGPLTWYAICTYISAMISSQYVQGSHRSEPTDVLKLRRVLVIKNLVARAGDLVDAGGVLGSIYVIESERTVSVP